MDLSFSEIADESNISRQAVYDLVKRAEALLEQYETKLGLVAKFQKTSSQLYEVQNLLEGGLDDPASRRKAIKIVRELTSLL
jgi:predicted DNA-binding protein YlxM (UPF0122 family)